MVQEIHHFYADNDPERGFMSFAAAEKHERCVKVSEKIAAYFLSAQFDRLTQFGELEPKDWQNFAVWLAVQVGTDPDFKLDF